MCGATAWGACNRDLSSNFFTGRYPDIWTNQGYLADASPPFSVSLNSVVPYVNISNTFFSGYQTLFFTTANFQYVPDDTSQWFPYNCINTQGVGGTTAPAQVLGDVSNSCVLAPQSGAFLGSYVGGEAQCDPTAVPTVRASDACYSWCGTNIGATTGLYPYPGPCNSRQGYACVPTFASATSNTVVSRSCVCECPAP